MRVLVDIDDHVLRAIGNLRAESDKSMGAVVSELLGEALAGRRARFHWISHDMKPLIDLGDKNSVRDVT